MSTSTTTPNWRWLTVAQVVSAGLAFKAHPLLMVVNATAVALAVIVLEVLFDQQK